MSASKTFFEQIPVETVKRIAKEFRDENPLESDGENTEMPGEARSPGESWREVAQKIQQERDPKKMTELVVQLLAMLDQERLSKLPPRARDTGNRSD